MIMALWQEILIISGSGAIGLLVGLALMFLLRRQKVKENSRFQNNAVIETADSKVAAANISRNGTTKSNELKSPLEVENHKNGITIENPQQPDQVSVSGGIATVNQRNAPVVEQQEKPAQHTIHWTELTTPSGQLQREGYLKPDKLPVSPEPVAINRQGAPLAEEHDRPVTSNIFREAENRNQKATLDEKKQTPVPMMAVSKKPEAIHSQPSPIVKTPKRSTKPLGRTADIANLEGSTAAEKHEDSTKSGLPEPAIIEQNITSAVEKQKGPQKSDFITELEANLAVASMPWADKLISFQTKCWDTGHGEFEPLLATHRQELIQLYVDIGLANNIVWLASEIGQRSKELDASYIRLCAGIADNIKRIAPSQDSIS